LAEDGATVIAMLPWEICIITSANDKQIMGLFLGHMPIPTVENQWLCNHDLIKTEPMFLARIIHCQPESIHTN
jgi:hypothetical protein